MRSDILVYSSVSFITFIVAFVVSLRSFIESDTWNTVNECYSTADIDTMNVVVRLLRESDQPPFRLFGQPDTVVCSSYLSAFFGYIETQKVSLVLHVNMAVCVSIILGRAIIALFFDDLWPTESQVSFC
ncbi:hypothetical protein J3Q64DRAFT_1237218 [Phycomyces blakesleeanus]|uniref:Uncharacterized protein n=1 Tax=Phycomyces blakesleeanus TaxID=4837 RepID=A0ABR3BAM6_PHYBL